MEIGSREDAAFGIFATLRAGEVPGARPATAAGPGRRGRLSLTSGAELKPKGFQVVPPGDRLVVEMPGGGGMGPAQERDPQAVRRDVRLGYVSRDGARTQYAADIE